MAHAKRDEVEAGAMCRSRNQAEGQAMTFFPKRKFVLVPRDVCRMTADEWRKTPDLVRAAQEVLKNQVTQNMLDICRNEILHYMEEQPPQTVEERMIQGARLEGAAKILQKFTSLGNFEVERQEVEATFQPEPME